MLENRYKIGDQISLTFSVTAQDTAMFANDQVHPVYATFALGRDAEWTCRQFVLQMKESDEEGIGTFLTINHHSPALLGQEVMIEATVKSILKNEIICSYQASVGSRIVATGETGQKILKKQRINQLFDAISQ